MEGGVSRPVISLDVGLQFIENVGMKTLKRKFDGLPNLNFTPTQYMELYTIIYNMAIQSPDFSQQLYDKYREFIEDYIMSTVVPSIREKSGELMLREVVKRWENHKIMVRFLSKFFYYLEIHFIKSRILPSLVDVGLSCFHNLVSEHSQVWDVVSSLIDQEREGKRVDRALANTFSDVLDEIGMGIQKKYPEYEAHCLKAASAYYSSKASAWILEYSSPDYFLKVEECLKKEEDIGSHYLKSSSVPNLMQRVRHELLSVYATQLLENEHSGVRALLRDNKGEDLSQIYRLFLKIPREPGRIAAIFKQHVVAEGMTLFNQAEDAAGNRKVISIRDLIEFHYKYIQYVNDHFSCATPLYNALKEAFEILCNKFDPKSSSAELLVTLCDDILKKGSSEDSSDEAIEDTLEKMVTCVIDKDLFAEFYRRKLARRFLFEKSANEEHERMALMKLKHVFGAQFIFKMEGMFTDLTLAKEKQTEFDNYIKSNPYSNPGIEFKPTVLNSAFWPLCKSVSMNLPQEMAKCIEGYQEFYQTKTKCRKLTWNYSLGTCYIDGRFNSKTIELIVTTSQAATLLLFNNSDTLSYSEIKTYLNLYDDDDVVRLLHSLSCGKYRILEKRPNTDTISSTDYFEFNSNFTDKMTRIKIPLPSIKATKMKKFVEDVVKDRRYVLEAAIVRIMKRHKVLNHQVLVMECVKQTSHLFKPDIKDMKKPIEDLIDREFLERDKKDPNVLKYLA
ncbi:hypothetical protein V2J09_015853 [Rumex salicifolius]